MPNSTTKTKEKNNEILQFHQYQQNEESSISSTH